MLVGLRTLLPGLLLRGVCSLLLVTVLLVYVPPTAVSLLALLLIGVAGLFLPLDGLLSLSVSLTVVTLILEIVVRSGATGVTAFYRPHEVLARDRAYEPSQRVEMTVPHGDLIATDPSLPKTMAETRHEVFVTDSFGYRNDRDYAGERLIVVGDSFLVGTESTLASRLRSRYGLGAYNVSFSGVGPLAYTSMVSWARDTLDDASCVAVFYFEGNDFQRTERAAVAARTAVPSGIQDALRAYINAIRGSSEWSKVFYGLQTRAASLWHKRNVPDAESVAFVEQVGGRPMAFLRGYASVVRRREFDDHGFVANQLAQAPPDLVVFVPDKFRVYAPFLSAGNGEPLPHAQWEYLKGAAAAVGVQAVDLTPHMIERAREALARGETLFWRDDSHWNSAGEDVAADVLVETLRQSPVPECRNVVSATANQ